MSKQSVIQPWKDACELRPEIRDRKLTASDFAVDLYKVINGWPGDTPFYCDPVAVLQHHLCDAESTPVLQGSAAAACEGARRRIRDQRRADVRRRKIAYAHRALLPHDPRRQVAAGRDVGRHDSE